MTQYWYLDGRQMTHEQVVEWKAKKDKEMAKKKVVKPVVEEKIEEKVVEEKVVGPVVEELELPTNFMQLKKYAEAKGMVVTKETKKPEILAFFKK